MQSSICSRIDPPRASPAGSSGIQESRSSREQVLRQELVGLPQMLSKLLTAFICYRISQMLSTMDIQRLQIEARGLTSKPTASNYEQPRRLTLIEARRQRCRQARYERYRDGAGYDRKRTYAARDRGSDRHRSRTISRWMKAGAFPERRTKKDLPDTATVERAHYSSSRVAALLWTPTKSLSREQAKILAHSSASARGHAFCGASWLASAVCSVGGAHAC